MQFAHTHMNEYSIPGTVVLDGMTKEHLKQLLDMHGTQLMQMVGISILSPHDHFNKKTGRELAIQRLSPQVLNFDGITPDGTKLLYRFHAKLKLNYKVYYINLTVSTVAESELVKLIGAYIIDETSSNF